MSDEAAPDSAADAPDTTADTEPASTTQEAPTETGVDDADSAATADGERSGWRRVVAFLVLPAVVLLLALGAGFLKWRADTVRDGERAATSAVQAAKTNTIALLSYRPDTVAAQLTAARDLTTGSFRHSYTTLTDDVVIPGAQQQRIAAVASVPAAASVSATPTKAVVLVFVNQTVTVGGDAPTDTASSVRVTLDAVGGRWLISGFDPV